MPRYGLEIEGALGDYMGDYMGPPAPPYEPLPHYQLDPMIIPLMQRRIEMEPMMVSPQALPGMEREQAPLDSYTLDPMTIPIGNGGVDPEIMAELMRRVRQRRPAP